MAVNNLELGKEVYTFHVTSIEKPSFMGQVTWLKIEQTGEVVGCVDNASFAPVGTFFETMEEAEEGRARMIPIIEKIQETTKQNAEMLDKEFGAFIEGVQESVRARRIEKQKEIDDARVAATKTIEIQD